MKRALAVATKAGQLYRRLPLKAKIGVAILGIYIVVAIIGPALAPYNPSLTTTQATPTGPSAAHLLGTDATGGDILSQLLVGTRNTVVVGLLAGVIATALAVAVGTTAGYLGGTADEGLSLISNVFVVIPALPFLVVILGFLPNTGVIGTALILSLLGWAWGARVIRAQTLSLRNRDFVLAAREVGESVPRVILHEIVPNEIGLIAASFVNTVLYAVLTSVSLAFLGLTSLTTWSYGVMLYWAQSESAVQLGAWWWYVFPGVAVAFLGMSLVLINFGLDELSNPRLRSPAGGTKRDRIFRRWRASDPTPVVSAIVPERVRP